MKRLRRKKSSNDRDVHGPTLKSETTPAQANEGPLYARFSAAHRGNDPSLSSKPVVSGPMSLTAKPTTTTPASRGTAIGGNTTKIVRVASRDDQSHKVIVSPPPRKSSRAAASGASHGQANHTHYVPAKAASVTSHHSSNDHGRPHPSQAVPAVTRPPSPPVPVREDLGRGHHHAHNTQPIRSNHEHPPAAPAPNPPQTSPSSRTELRQPPSHAPLTKERPRVHVAPKVQQVSSYNDDDEYDPFRVIPTITRASSPPQNTQSRLVTASKEPIVQGNSAPVGLPDASQSRLPQHSETNHSQSSPPPTRPTPTPARLPLSSPSLARKKYSPLAAFGLPSAQPASAANLTSQSSGTLSQEVKAIP